MSTHTLDANILIALERLYPRDVFGFLWEGFESAVAAGEVCLCEEAHDELSRGTDGLHDWAKNLKGFVCKVTDEEFELAQAIAGAHPEWVRERTNAADPFVIAHAKCDEVVIVTNERRAGRGVIDKNQKIPNVASEHGVACMDFLSYVRHKQWTA